MKFFILSLTATMTFITLASCERKQVTLVLCFIDLSSRDSVAIEWYKESFKDHLLRNLPPETRLVVLPVDYASQTGSTELFRVDFSKNKYGNEYAGLQAAEIEQQQHQDSVSAAIQQFDRTFNLERQQRLQFPEGTDLFGALKQCAKYSVPGQRTLVVVFSDMLQFTDRQTMNFETRLANPDEIEQYLSGAEKVDLQGMEIIILTGPQRDMKPQKYAVIKVFWELYIQQCNGKLLGYSSGAVSQLETVLKVPEQ